MDNFTIVASQPHCHIEYFPELKCIIQTWRGRSKSHQFRESIEATIEFAKTHTTASIISDTRQHEMISLEDAEWLAKEGNPRLVQSGLQRLAFVSPNNPFAARVQDSYAEKSKDEIDFQWFPNPDSARAWIEQQV